MSCYILTSKKGDQRLFRKLIPDPLIFDNPRELLLAVHSTTLGPIVVIDLEIHGYDKIGLQVAALIKRNNPNAQIILLAEDSRLANYCFEYQVGVLDFIIKNDRDLIFQKRLLRAIEKAQYNVHKILNSKPKFIFFPNGKKRLLLDLSRILYFSSEKGTHNVILHEHDQILKIRANLSTIAKLDDDIHQIHSGFCININYLQTYQPKKNIVTLANGVSLPISRNYINKVRQQTTWYSEPPTRENDPNFKKKD
ncbi:LytR/AlgR family response regulator transcription factor [Fructobacillus ficulneus]|uniref:Response regulator n=1 Tax=Fructobacillus ficulneus TaxID=157463 RepID=A0A0K8MF54_9LACO|nr:LytTR family DNA-binding domain-containing protein [Fructobacillus ficulneus]GAO99150.1 response regulator [Fructobacillus ficulneus]